MLAYLLAYLLGIMIKVGKAIRGKLRVNRLADQVLYMQVGFDRTLVIPNLCVCVCACVKCIVAMAMQDRIIIVSKATKFQPENIHC